MPYFRYRLTLHLEICTIKMKQAQFSEAVLDYWSTQTLSLSLFKALQTHQVLTFYRAVVIIIVVVEQTLSLSLCLFLLIFDLFVPLHLRRRRRRRRDDSFHLQACVCFYLKMGQPRPLFHLFSSFQMHYKFYKNTNVNKCPSSIRCRDSNSRPLKHKPPPITTRPGLPSTRPSSVCLFRSDSVQSRAQIRRNQNTKQQKTSQQVRSQLAKSSLTHFPIVQLRIIVFEPNRVCLLKFGWKQATTPLMSYTLLL